MKENPANMQSRNQVTRFVGILVIGLLIIVLAWLVLRPSTQSTPTVLSLNDVWDSLETNAHNLQQDAYLTNITIYSNSKNPYSLIAEYHSASVADKMIYVEIDHFNKIDAEWLNLLPSSSGAQKPIQRSDWAIDSQEALSIFAEDEMVDACLKSSKSSSMLSLNRRMTESASWSLALFDCPTEGKIKLAYLNAQSGESLDPFSQ